MNNICIKFSCHNVRSRTPPKRLDRFSCEKCSNFVSILSSSKNRPTSIFHTLDKT